MVPSAERRAHPFPPVEMLLPASVDRFPCFHTCPAYEQKKRAIPGRIFLIAIYIPMVPSAERQNATFPPVEILLPASVDRFPCFHTCPAYEQKKRANPGRIFLIAIYIHTILRNLLVCYRPLKSQLCLVFLAAPSRRLACRETLAKRTPRLYI